MFNRRKLFGFAVAAPAVAFLPNNHVKAEVNKEDVSSNAPTSGPIIQIQAQAQERMRITSGGNVGIGETNPYTISMMSYQPTGPKLGISVGKDGHMWVKINDKWKRVVVE